MFLARLKVGKVFVFWGIATMLDFHVVKIGGVDFDIGLVRPNTCLEVR
jgi:hypothetical protein